MILEFVAGQSQEFDVSLLELVLVDGDATKFSRTHRGEVGRMREQDTPAEEKRHASRC